jgi:hypothetical protein
MLLNNETRSQLLNDLEEIEAFLRQRLFELQSSDQSVFNLTDKLESQF